MSGIEFPDAHEHSEVAEMLLAHEKNELAPLYSVLMHDDPVTTMDFVVTVLVSLFNYDRQSAFEIMYRVHTTGVQKIATLPLDKAEVSVTKVRTMARANGFPLTCTLEKE